MEEAHERLVFGAGQVSIKPWNWLEHENTYDVAIILIVGSTGSGKSSFIESLSGNTSMEISKDQLEGFTKAVTPYELVNAGYGHGGGYNNGEKICLLDTPGFSDSNLSELEIIEMVKEWLKSNGLSHIHHIMYMCSITDTRIPGSRKATMQMMKSLIKLGKHNVQGDLSNEGAVTIVTTMWDSLWSDRARSRAESNYDQLANVVWKELIDCGAYIGKFLNTPASAFQILDKSRVHWGAAYGNAYETLNDKANLQETEYGQHLYQDLIERVKRAREQQRVLEIERDLAQTGMNEQWLRIIQERLDEAKHTLARFEGQLEIFGGLHEGFNREP